MSLLRLKIQVILRYISEFQKLLLLWKIGTFGKWDSFFPVIRNMVIFRTFHKTIHSPNARKIAHPFAAYAFMPDGLFALLVIKMWKYSKKGVASCVTWIDTRTKIIKSSQRTYNLNSFIFAIWISNMGKCTSKTSPGPGFMCSCCVRTLYDWPRSQPKRATAATRKCSLFWFSVQLSFEKKKI